MTARLNRAIRELFARERIPVRLRWWFAAEGTSEWFRNLREGLAPELGGDREASRTLATLAAPMFERRYDLVRTAHPSLPDRRADPRIVGLFMGGLYRVASNPGATWALEGVGGAPRGFAEHLRAERAMAPLDARARWEEITTHLGELLIALTEGLPALGLSRARPILGRICFDAGVRYAKKIKRAFDLAETPEGAMEVLRMSEYIFRVNPAHWGATDAASGTGFLEGTACPWYTAPGWTGTHCGIFGQFQSGITSVFGLRYQLTTTIPKHGGHTCRIDVRPIALSRRAAPSPGTGQ